jgi:hypothetical protein
MDAFFIDPEVERVPPASVRVLNVQSAPSPGGDRIRLSLELTPFQTRPNIELILMDPSGTICGSTSILEPMGWKMVLTLHNRLPTPQPGTYQLNISISYPDLGEVESKQVPVEISTTERTE